MYLRLPFPCRFSRFLEACNLRSEYCSFDMIDLYAIRAALAYINGDTHRKA